MPQAFTEEQMNRIRQKLFQSACRYAVKNGVRKTSIEMLTQDADISKSTFYKFFDSKEQLFLKVAQYFEERVLEDLRRGLRKTNGRNNKERAALAVNEAFVFFARLGAQRFLSDDMPWLIQMFTPEEARVHLKSLSEKLMEVLEEEGICFSQPRESVIAVIKLLFRSIPAITEIDNFVDAFHTLVLGACHQLIE